LDHDAVRFDPAAECFVYGVPVDNFDTYREVGLLEGFSQVAQNPGADRTAADYGQAKSE